MIAVKSQESGGAGFAGADTSVSARIFKSHLAKSQSLVWKKGPFKSQQQTPKDEKDGPEVMSRGQEMRDKLWKFIRIGIQSEVDALEEEFVSKAEKQKQ